MKDSLRNLGKKLVNLHIPDQTLPDIFLFATPRGGSTWFMELISSQPGFRYCDEPLNIRSPEVKKYSGFCDWPDLYGDAAGDRFDRYFTGLSSGSIDFRNPNPLKPHYRFLTRRVVFKIIHGGMDRVNWFRDRFNARILLCLRHPIAVSLSRQEFPFLAYFPESALASQFTKSQQTLVRRVIDKGSHLEKGIVAWCVHNCPALRDVSSDWTVVTYEQAVTDPAPLIDYICRQLELPDQDRVIRQLDVPSNVTNKSDQETRDLLADSSVSRNKLVTKWMQRVSQEEAKSCMSLLEEFEIDLYRYDDPLPSGKYWIGGEPPVLSGQAVTGS